MYIYKFQDKIDFILLKYIIIGIYSYIMRYYVVFDTHILSRDWYSYSNNTLHFERINTYLDKTGSIT